MTNNSSFSGKIIQKFMTAEEFGKFVERYLSHRTFNYKTREANDQDKDIFKDYVQNDMSIKDLAKKYNVSQSKIGTSIVKASKLK